MLKWSCQSTGRQYGLKTLPVSHTENLGMGQGVQNYSFMDSSTSSTKMWVFFKKGLPKRERAPGKEMPSPAPFSHCSGQCLLVSPGGKSFPSHCVREKEGEKTTWSRRAWNSTGPRRVVPWFGIKPFPVVAEGHQGTRGGCQPEGCPSHAHLTHHISALLEVAPGNALGCQEIQSRGRRTDRSLPLGSAAALGRAGPCLGGFPSPRHIEHFPSSSACHRPDCNCLAAGTGWLNRLKFSPKYSS